jgi:hypothetical protein
VLIGVKLLNVVCWFRINKPLNVVDIALEIASPRMDKKEL